MVIQIDGKYTGELSGYVPCVAVCVIPGRLVNILTRLPDHLGSYLMLERVNPDGTVTKKVFDNDGQEIDPFKPKAATHGQI